MKAERIAYVSRADVSAALAVIARKQDLTGQIIELTGPVALSMSELASAISEATRTTINFQTITDDEYRDICRRENLPDVIIEMLVTLYKAAEAQEFANVSRDVELLTGAPPESVTQAILRLSAGH
jgi:uncharacterized protein YbjT (DUF2867 family)